jgi:hypothetical protein
VAAEPQHTDGGDVQDQHHQREHQRQPATGPDRDCGQVVVGGREALRLVGLAHERPHDADAGDLLTQQPVDLVDAALHQAEAGHHPAHHDADGQ